MKDLRQSRARMQYMRALFEAAALFGIRQPDVSRMLRGDFRQFSVERLLRFLVALDHDVEIVVKPHRSRGDAAAMQVV